MVSIKYLSLGLGVLLICCVAPNALSSTDNYERQCLFNNSSAAGSMVTIGERYSCAGSQVSDSNSSSPKTEIDFTGTIYLYLYCYPPDEISGLSKDQYYSQVSQWDIVKVFPTNIPTCWAEQAGGPDTNGVTWKKIICQSTGESTVQVESIGCEIVSN